MGSAAAASTALLAIVVVVACSVFLSVVGVVACVKVIQIAEDVRFIRSKSDIHVQRPMPTRKILVICAVVSVVLLFFALTFLGALAGSVQSLPGLSA